MRCRRQLEAKVMTDLYAVIGKPVLHSRSPQMHNAAFAELGIGARYVRIAADSREEGLRLAKELGVRGMNVTSPFKDIIGTVDVVDPLAERTGAVNTILFEGGKTVGYNTDVDGVTRSFMENGVGIKGKKALVLGAGGAARAAVVAMLENGAKVVVTNRTADKAKMLAEEFGVEYCPLDGLGDVVPDCQLIVGCLSTAERVVPKNLLRKEMAILDAYYASETALIRDGKESGCKTMDGLEWLLQQGMECFGLFTGKEAPLEAMKDAIVSTENKQNIALIGFMGSGKDTIAREIKERKGMAVLDIDREIEKKAGMPIKEIFEQKGEDEFRKMEKDELASLAEHKDSIINCGGGAILDPQNRKMLKENAIVVWLWADAKTILERVPKDDGRPLLNVADPEKAVGELLSDRLGFYADTCDVIVDTVGKSPAEIAERISYEIRTV